MTKQDADELGRRALACKHWRWTPGTLAADAGGNLHRVIEHDEGREYVTTMLRDYNDAHCESSARAVDLTPVLDDPATMGCLLYLVREAWGAERASAWWCGPLEAWGADVRRFERGRVFNSDTEAGALVAALEAAP